jgi:hypothetical protein
MHVHGGSRLGVGITIANGQLEVRLRMALLEEGPFSQDEAVGIKLEMRRVVKDHLAYMRLVLRGLFQFNSQPFGDGMGMLEKLVKAVFVDEALWLEQQLVLSIVNLRLGTELASLSLVTSFSVAHDSRLLPDVAPHIANDLVMTL